MDKTAPNSIELEQCVLGGCLVSSDNATDACILLTPQDFYRTSHQIIFRHIRNLVKKGNPVDAPTVLESVMSSGELEQAGGATTISGLLDMIGASDMKFYCQKIREYASKRRVIELMNAGMKRAHSGEEILDTLIYLQGELDKVDPSVEIKETYSHLDSLLVDASIRYDEIRKGKIVGVKTGYESLDHKLLGLSPADLIILAARPSMGKTALAMNIARQTAANGDRVAVFSLEQSKEQLTNRIISSETGINLKKFKHCHFSKEEESLIADASGEMYRYPLVIDDRPGLTVTEIKMAIRKMNSEGKLGCVIIDYLQLINSKDAENRNLQVGAICRELKAIAKEFNIPIICLSQLNRELEKRPNPNKRPKMSDLRDSGEIEQVADVIMFIYRGEVYNDNEMPAHCADIIIEKYRDGETGTIRMHWLADSVTFKDIPPEDYYEYQGASQTM